MTDLEQRLRDELPGLVPDPPAAPDRAEGARVLAARARRRTALAVAAAVVVVAGAIATPVLLRGADGPEPAPSPAEDLVCPTRVADVGGSGPLGEDPVAARLCSWDGAVDSVAVQPPVDALVEDVDDLARTINALPLNTDGNDEPGCGTRIGPGFVLVLAYPDGSERALIGSDYGCPQLAVVGGPTHTRPSEALTAFTRALHDQRAHTTPPDVATPPLECGAWPFVPPADGQAVTSLATIDEVDQAIVCFQGHRRTLTPLETLRQADVSADELAGLRAGWAEEGSSQTGCTARDAAWVVGSTPWGETLRADLCSNLAPSADPLVASLDARAVPE